MKIYTLIRKIMELAIVYMLYVWLVVLVIHTLDLERYPLPLWFLILAFLGALGLGVIMAEWHHKRGLHR